MLLCIHTPTHTAELQKNVFKKNSPSCSLLWVTVNERILRAGAEFVGFIKKVSPLLYVNYTFGIQVVTISTAVDHEVLKNLLCFLHV